MTRAGGGGQAVPAERRYPLEDQVNLEGRCEYSNVGSAAMCPLLVTVIEERYTLFEYERIMNTVPAGEQGLPDEFATLKTTLDACK